MKRIRWIVGCAMVVVAVGGGLSLRAALAGHEQPIAFNHRLHVEDVGLQCVDCHLYVMNAERATIPNIEVCSDCHSEPLTESPAEARVVEHVGQGESIPWRKIYAVPEHVFFSHRRHTSIGGVECERCHGPVGSRELPVTRQLVDISMDSCMDCHDASGVSNDCLLCHY